MTFPNKAELEQHFADELCKVANHRFGYQMGLELVLKRATDLDDKTIDRVIKLARDRELYEIELILEKMNHEKKSQM